MFIVYTKENCPQCEQAKSLLSTKGLPFKTVKLGEEISREELLAKFPSARTMPQISKGEVPVGGLSELRAALS